MSEKLKRMIERMKVQRVLGSLKTCRASIHSNHGVDHLSSGGVTHPRRSHVASTSWFYASLFSIVMLLVPTGLTSLTKTGWRWVLRRPGTEWSTTLSQWRRSWLVYHLQPVARIVIGAKGRDGTVRLYFLRQTERLWCLVCFRCGFHDGTMVDLWLNCNELENCPGFNPTFASRQLG